MKEALGGVRAEAAMIRSPSFSRDGLSSTMTNSPFAVSLVSQGDRVGGLDCADQMPRWLKECR